MPEPVVRLPLSAGQQALVAELVAERERVELALTATAKAIVAADRALSAIDGWQMQLLPDAVVLTPPADPTPDAQDMTVAE